MSSLPSFDLERARVREAYGRRDARRDARLYSHFNQANLLSIQERERRVLALLDAYGFSDLPSLKILEVGCGSGFWIRQFTHWGAKPENLTGIDLLSGRTDDARRSCAPGVVLQCQDARQLTFDAGSFDLVIASTVFSSVLDARVRAQVAAEILRVLRPSGAVLWYDFFRNNPSNRDVAGVRKHEIERIFPGCRLHVERVTLAPPLARRLAGFSANLCRLLAGLRVFNTHYLGFILRSR